VAAEQRRIVTVLFADLVGFTALAEEMDPEQVKRLIEVCFEDLTADIDAFGGRVDKLLGDGILALFGAPIAHEDDPERAVRCALRMHATLTATLESTPLGAAHEGLQMRIGINTGEVLMGTVGTDYTAMGDVVNIASRLQSMAPPGGVLVGQTTHLATVHAINYEPVGLIQPRGREQGVDAWLATHPIAPPGTGRAQTDVALVGRDHEMALGASVFQLAVTQNRGALISIVAENGVGKSRLISEFTGLLQTAHGGLVLHGSCVPYGEANHWWPIASALSAGLGLTVSGDAIAIGADVIAAVTALNPTADSKIVEMNAEVMLHLLGQPSRIDQLDPTTAQATIHQSVVRLLSALRGAPGQTEVLRPVTLAVDDLHWASAPVLDLLQYLVGLLGRVPVLVITGHRPEGELTWPPSVDHAIALALYLDPLDQQAAVRMATELLTDSSKPSPVDPPLAGPALTDPLSAATPVDDQLVAGDTQRLATAIFERSGGNPLFIQEMAALAASGESVYTLPATLRTLIGARLDQLGSTERRILENAATLGLSGTVVALERFTQEMRQPYTYGDLLDLGQRGLLEVGGGRWRFRSDSIRDAAYQTMTKSGRARRHAEIARALAQMAQAPADDLAHHTATAAELVVELGQVDGIDPGIVASAIQLLIEAARRALSQGTMRLAVHHASRALSLVSGHPSVQAQRNLLLLMRAHALLELRNFASARTDVDVVLADVARRPDVATEAEALRILGGLHHADGQQDMARVALGRAVDLLRHVELPAALARTLRSRGYIELFNGSLSDAEWFFGEADSLYAELDDEAGRAWIEQHRALAAFLSGDLEAARVRLTSVLQQMSALGDRNGVGWASGLLAFVAFYNRDFAEAARLAQHVGEGASERGDDWAEAMMLTLQAHLAVWRGDLEGGLDKAERARQRFRRLGDTLGIVQAASVLVRAQISRGRFDEAQQTSQELLSLAETSPLGAFALVAVANAALHRGNSEAALSLAERAIERMRAANMMLTEPTMTMVFALIQAGRVEAATEQLAALGDQATLLRHSSVAAALLSAVSGQRQRADELATDMIALDGTAYFDRIVAELIRATQGDHIDALANARRLANEVGDVVAQSIAAAVAERLDPQNAPGEHPELTSGWATVVRLLTEGVPA